MNQFNKEPQHIPVKFSFKMYSKPPTVSIGITYVQPSKTITLLNACEISHTSFMRAVYEV